MKLLRRKLLEYTALFPFATFAPSSAQGFIVQFTWTYPKPMNRSEAPILEGTYMNYERLNELNEAFQMRGWIKKIEIEYGSKRADYVYEFSSYSAFLLWGFRKNVLDLIDYSKGREQYKITMSFPGSESKLS